LALSAQSLLADGGAITSTTFGSGRGGDLVLDLRQLSLTHGGQITAHVGGVGRGGNVTVTATDLVALSGSSSTGNPGGIFSNSCNGCAGRPGDIALNAGRFSLTDGARVQSGSIIDRQGGRVTIAARDGILISGKGNISSQTFSQDADSVAISTPGSLIMDNGAIDTTTLGNGRAADISVNVGALTLTGGAQIVNSNAAAGLSRGGGNLTVTATGPVLISGTSFDGQPVSRFSKDVSSGLFSTAAKDSVGPAGHITVNTPTLAVRDGGKISVATEGPGRAGDIALKVGTLSLTGGAHVDSSTSGAGRGGAVTVNATGPVSVGSGGGLSSNAGSSGAGGDINIRAGQVELTGGARISATSSATGNAGTLTIDAGDAFRSQDSFVTTEARQADGGSISLSARSMIHLIDSRITTSVGSGTGKGGNITLDPTFVILDHSQIRADAFGGPGGNVNIAAAVYLTTDSVVTASSALGVPGTINIQASITNVSGTLAQLPGAVLQAAALLRASCGARLAAGRASSLVLAGREGLPLEPSSLLPSAILAEGPADAGLSWSEGHPWEIFSRLSRSVAGPKCSM
jgi:large exoprotein involved in heme utilization and adhesion